MYDGIVRRSVPQITVLLLIVKRSYRDVITSSYGKVNNMKDSKEPKICLALGGGAVRGLAHLGVLKAFEDARVPFDMIAGTSLGALIGGLYASQPDADYWMGRVEQYLRSFRSRKTRRIHPEA